MAVTLSPKNLDDSLLQVASLAADQASELLLSYYGQLKDVREKEQASLVSEADRASEELIRKILAENFPDHGIWGEEFGSHQLENAKAIWFIDPLDGTTNYVHQFPLFCISIGCEVNGELRMGLVHAPVLKSRFHALRGKGAYLNGQRIHCSSRENLGDALCVTGFHNKDAKLQQQLDTLNTVIRQTRGVRRGGSAALDLCWVAQGVFDIYWERDLAPWDTAAGALIAQEAGAMVTDYRGNKFDPRRKSILAANPKMHASAKAWLSDL